MKKKIIISSKFGQYERIDVIAYNSYAIRISNKVQTWVSIEIQIGVQLSVNSISC